MFIYTSTTFPVIYPINFKIDNENTRVLEKKLKQNKVDGKPP